MVFRGKLPDLLLHLVEAGQESWGFGAPFPGLAGVGNSMALGYREAKPRTLIGFPKHLGGLRRLSPNKEQGRAAVWEFVCFVFTAQLPRYKK